ncbi:Kae1-associated serine/threonine protein kinase, partial [Candidatus Woesearchaeota archaeon]|nr:Kae1-associated serine/threonine protein kinase [Candidatus Woesearchaeota archaeon]
KVFGALSKAGIPIPKLISSSDKEMKIEMEHIEGRKLADALDTLDSSSRGKCCGQIGEKIGMMHASGIIHADLTTSNMILGSGEERGEEKEEKVYFIDFGLSFFSDKAEDKAVDLHLLKQALQSRHNAVWKQCFEAALKGYAKTYPRHREVLARLEKVEKRGRYKGKAPI